MSQTEKKDQHAGIVSRHVARALQFLESILYESLNVVVEVLLLRVERAMNIVHQAIGQIQERLAIENGRLRPAKHACVEYNLKGLTQR